LTLVANDNVYHTHNIQVDKIHAIADPMIVGADFVIVRVIFQTLFADLR
jgi:hypothetical protein